MALQLNDHELNTLAGLAHYQVCLYLFGIRRYMDFSTGIVGIKRGISYQSLSEELYIEPVRGVKTPKWTRQQVRRAVKSLERAGLIVSKAQGLQLVFECVLATQDKFIQNKADTRPAQLGNTDLESAHDIKTADSASAKPNHAHKADTKANTARSLKADTPPISGKIKKNTILSSESIVKKEKLAQALSADFVIKPIHLELAEKNDWPDPHEQLDAFRDYHLARGNKMKDWDRAFYTWQLGTNTVLSLIASFVANKPMLMIQINANKHPLTVTVANKYVH